MLSLRIFPGLIDMLECKQKKDLKYSYNLYCFLTCIFCTTCLNLPFTFYSFLLLTKVRTLEMFLINFSASHCTSAINRILFYLIRLNQMPF